MTIKQSVAPSATPTQDVQAHIMTFLVDITGMQPSELDLISSFESLGLDKYDCIELTMRLEDVYGVIIESDEVACPYDYVHYIQTLLEKKYS